MSNIIDDSEFFTKSPQKVIDDSEFFNQKASSVIDDSEFFGVPSVQASIVDKKESSISQPSDSLFDMDMAFPEAHQQEILTLTPVNPVSAVDTAAAFLGPGLANFILKKGGGAMIRGLDKFTGDSIYEKKPVDVLGFTSRLNEELNQLAAPRDNKTELYDTPVINPIMALQREVQSNPPILNPTAVARAQEMENLTKEFEADPIGEFLKNNAAENPQEAAFNADTYSIYQNLKEKYPRIANWILQGEPLTEGGRQLMQDAVDPVMHKIDMLAEKAGHVLGDPNDPRDAEFYKSGVLLFGARVVKKAAEGAVRGVKTLKDFQELQDTMAAFEEKFRENPRETVHEVAEKYTDMTPDEIKSLLKQVDKTYEEPLAREQRIAELVAQERTARLPMEKFEDFIMQRSNLSAIDKADFLERGRKAKTEAELDTLYTEYANRRTNSKIQSIPDTAIIESPNKLSSMPIFDPAKWREFAKFVGWGKKTNGKQLLDSLLAKGIKQSDLNYLGWFDYLRATDKFTPDAKKMWEMGKGRLDVVKKDLGNEYGQFTGYAGTDYNETGYSIQTYPLRAKLREVLTPDEYARLNFSNKQQPVKDILAKFLPKYANDAKFKQIIKDIENYEGTFDTLFNRYKEPHFGEAGENLVFHTRSKKVMADSLSHDQLLNIIEKEAPEIYSNVDMYIDAHNALPTEEIIQILIENVDNFPKELFKESTKSAYTYAIEEIQSVWKKDFEKGKTNLVPPLRSSYVDVALGDIVKQAQAANTAGIIWQHPKYFKETVGMERPAAEAIYGSKGEIAKWFKKEYGIEPQPIQVQGKDSYFIPTDKLAQRESVWSKSYKALTDWLKLDPNSLSMNFANLDLLSTIELGARRNQMSIAKYLESTGMHPDRARQMALQIQDGLKLAHDLGVVARDEPLRNFDPYMAQAIANGIKPLNEKERYYERGIDGRTTRKPRVNPAPAISEQLVREMKDSVNPDFTTGIANPRYVIKNPMQSAVDALGEFGRKHLYEPLLDATAGQNRMKKFMHTQLDKWAKGLKLTDKMAERIGNYAMSIQHNGIQRLQQMGVTPLVWTDLTYVEQTAFKSLESFYEHMYDLSNEARIKSGYAPLKKVANYNPMQTIYTFTEAAVDDIALWRRDIKWAQKKFANMQKPTWAYKRGKVGQPGVVYELNILKQMKKHSDSVLWHVYLSPLVASIHELLSKHDVTGLPGWKQAVNPTTGKFAKVTKYSLRKEAPEVYGALANYANFVHSRYVKRAIKIRALSDLALKLSHNVGFAYVAGNLQTVLNQFGSVVNTLSLSDPISTMYGVTKTALPNEWNTALRESRFLRERINTPYELFMGTPAKPARTRIGKGYEYIKQATLVPMQFADAYNVMLSWQTGKAYAEMYYNLKGMDAIRYADEFAVKAQSSSLPVHTPPLMRTDIGRVATVLQTFQINQFNVMIDDILKVKGGNKRNKLERIMRPLLLASSIWAFNSLYKDGLKVVSPFPSPIDYYLETLMETESNPAAIIEGMLAFRDAIPFISSGKYGGGVMGPVVQAFEEGTGTRSPSYKQNFVKQWIKNEENGYSKWENFRAFIAHPMINGILKGIGMPLANQLRKWSIVAERADIKGEDIPTFNQWLGSYKEPIDN